MLFHYKSETYWKVRKHLIYYQVVKSWLESFGDQNSILDIGCRGCPTSTWGTFLERTAIDSESFLQINGVLCVREDWLKFKSKHYSVITCMQVLEHLDDETVAKFVSKIFNHCDKAIISVPYRWQIGFCKHHLQDPIDIKKFLNMIGRDPIKTEIVSNRLVGLFQK